ncbi:DNA excision repair protein ERCC-6-like 2 [Nematolebias whitei]|uniref:DNA excision repair protein ERCC-6-like 2 n=1 Tax=Nematolebias whitei TaxID=451745 RepID=UPI00189987C9|nr:DNA excision repair protein ERCC-6-like 2 [Nematolebias whitei]
MAAETEDEEASASRWVARSKPAKLHATAGTCEQCYSGILMTSASDKAKWCEGDQAPKSRDGIMGEATIQRMTSTTHNKDPIRVNLEEEQDEEAIPVQKLTRPGLNQYTQEKPLFPGITTDLSLCIPLELSDEDGVPYTINRYLRDYQREGIRFIYNNYIHSTGCILGDDMGLGKTVQIIGFLAAVLHKTGTWEDVENNRPQFLQSQISSKQSNPSKVFLIVAPLSVLYNWKDELDTWGYFQCVVVHGLRKEEELARIKNGRTEIALTTYETLRLCLDQFNKLDWSAIVVDEAHKIKNPNSQITQAMKEMRCKIRIGLTGTILQNNLEELWCVMDWAVPACLGSLGHFKNKFSDPIEQGQRHSATKRALATARKTVRDVVKKISPFFLRRTKALIKDQLPKKNDRVVFCSLTDFQQSVYQAVLDSDDVTLLLRSSEKCDCQSGRTRRSCCYDKNSDGVRIKELFFSYLTILRKVANHAALLQSSPGTSEKQEMYVRAVCTKVFQKFPEFVQRCRDEAFEALSDPMYSGKMKVLQKLLKYHLQKRDKVLIFSFSTKLLDILESYCMAEGLDFSRLDGSTKSKERLQIVKDFNSSSHINLCLVSTMAGGLGLNFVGANVVVLFDPTWNPASDLQAIDRAYRIGQCRDVTVLRLISLGTVEEVIYLRQVYKQQLQCTVVGKESARRYFEAVQGNGVYKGELFGVKNLFRLQTDGTCLTRRILEREGQVEAGVVTMTTHRGNKEEEETDGAGESGDPLADDNLLDDEAAKMTREESGVLDFSSGSETNDEEVQGMKRNQNGDGDNKSGKTRTGSGPMSLLQHGFSRHLEKVKEKQELDEEDSSSCSKESSFEEDAEGQNIKDASSTIGKTTSGGTGVVCLSKSETKPPDKSTGSDRKQENNANKISSLKVKDYTTRRRQCQKRWMSKQTALDDDESDENSSPENKTANKHKSTFPKVHHFYAYSDESEDLDVEEKTCSKKDLNVYNGGDEERRGKLYHNKRRHSASVRDKTRFRYTEDIGTFTSSEDEHLMGRRAKIPKTVSFTNLKSQNIPSSKEKKQSIDSVLGGVQEVVYTHSNQHVVGGSKAEELISRAAVRDVFERKMYSQLPANNLLGTQESLPASLLDSQPCTHSSQLQKLKVDHPISFTSRSVHRAGQTTVMIGETPKAIRRQQLEVMAEQFKFPSVHEFATEILRGNSSHRLSWLRQYYTSLNHTDVADIITENIPEPDSAQAASSATSTLSSSTKRASRNRYTDTRNQQKESLRTPKSAKFSQRNLKPRSKPEPPQNNDSSPQIRSGNLENDDLKPPKKPKIIQKNVPVPNPESEKQEEMVCGARGHKRTKKSSVSSSRACRTDGALSVDQASSSGLGSREAAAFLNCTDRDTPSSSDPSRCSSAMSSKPAGQETEQEQKSPRWTSEIQRQRENSQSSVTSCNQSLLTDLIGDTSILDDILKPKAKNPQHKSNPETPRTPSASLSTGLKSPPSNLTLDDACSHIQTEHRVSTPVQVTRSRRKDIWDILSEGNEESINRLTDPEELQRVCIDTSFAERSLSKKRESTSLWKTNDKFLWKK